MQCSRAQRKWRPGKPEHDAGTVIEDTRWLHHDAALTRACADEDDREANTRDEERKWRPRQCMAERSGVEVAADEVTVAQGAAEHAPPAPCTRRGEERGRRGEREEGEERAKKERRERRRRGVSEEGEERERRRRGERAKKERRERAQLSALTCVGASPDTDTETSTQTRDKARQRDRE
eukprot:1672732-Rhodomonas_salina.1